MGRRLVSSFFLVDGLLFIGAFAECLGLSPWSIFDGYFLDGTTATQINKVVCHPTLPLIITAHEDRFIRLFDVNTGMLPFLHVGVTVPQGTWDLTFSYTSGECTHSQIGHLEGVTTLDIAPGGLTMASGGTCTLSQPCMPGSIV